MRHTYKLLCSMYKTQISILINGQKTVIRDENNPKYTNAPMSTSHNSYAGTNASIREEIANKVFAENPKLINICVRGKHFTLKKHSTLSGKTSWYETIITSDDFLLLSDYNMLPYTAETEYTLKIEADMKVCITLVTRRNEKSQWRYRTTIYIGEEFITII